MFNEAHISFTGYVAKQPEAKMVTVDGVAVPSLRMRVGWTERRFDRGVGEWVDGATSYVTVNCWRKLAKNAGVCIRKGDPVLVKGKLSVRTFTGKDGVARNTVEVEASFAFPMSTSHSGNRLSTSSSATRPSRRARAAPRQ